MFVIFNPNNNLYISANGKVITFESQDEINEFLQGFSQYSMTKGMMQNPFEMQNIMNFFNNVKVEPFSDRFTCESIAWKEYKNLKERKN